MDPLGHRAASKGRGFPWYACWIYLLREELGSQKNLIFILLRLIKNIERSIERKFVSWNCIDDGNGRTFCSIVEGGEKS